MLRDTEIDRILNKFLETNADAKVIEIAMDFSIYYFKTLTNGQQMLHEIKQKYYTKDFDFEAYFHIISEEIKAENILNSLYNGFVVAFYKGEIFSIPGPQDKKSRPVGELLRESTLEGGLQGFVEDIPVNINLVRQLYDNPGLELTLRTIGTAHASKVAILFDRDSADESLVKAIEKKLDDIDVPIVQAAAQLQQYLLKGQWLIPRLLTTERPDRVVKNLINGRVVIFLEGTPTTLIAPANFHDFMSAVDDHYSLPIPAFFLITLRYLALLISILFPASYVAFSAYNPEVYRVQLALSIAGCRSNVPYPAFIEVIFMLVMMEFLIEASVRLPKTVGQAAATVGGLILGQAATQAQLVSNIMIIVVASVAISNFVIPITTMGFVIRVGKYILLIFASMAGLYGLLIGLICFVFYLFTLNSFSTPFFNPAGVDFKTLFSRFRKGNF